MDQETIDSVYHKASSNPDLFRDALRLKGILYKYPNNASFEIDILPCSLTPYSILNHDLQFLHRVQLIYQKFLFRVTEDK